MADEYGPVVLADVVELQVDDQIQVRGEMHEIENLERTGMATLVYTLDNGRDYVTEPGHWHKQRRLARSSLKPTVDHGS